MVWQTSKPWANLSKLCINELLGPLMFQDEAIVSALPKRVTNPIRVEDLEKIGFGHQVNQLPPNLRPFMNGAPKLVRPPPGFPPNMSARVSKTWLKITKYLFDFKYIFPCTQANDVCFNLSPKVCSVQYFVWLFW